VMSDPGGAALSNSAGSPHAEVLWGHWAAQSLSDQQKLSLPLLLLVLPHSCQSCSICSRKSEWKHHGPQRPAQPGAGSSLGSALSGAAAPTHQR